MFDAFLFGAWPASVILDGSVESFIILDLLGFVKTSHDFLNFGRSR